METQRAEALFYFLPRGEDTGCRQGFAGGGQLTANDFQALPRAGAGNAQGEKLNPSVPGQYENRKGQFSDEPWSVACDNLVSPN